MSITISFDPNDGDDVAYVQALLSGDAAEPESAPAPKKATRAKAAAAEPEPEPEATGVTLEDAVARATELVGEGRAADVKGALANFGVKRVSELSEDQVEEFLAALNEESVV